MNEEEEEGKKMFNEREFYLFKNVWLANESLESSQVNEKNKQTNKQANKQTGRQAGRLADELQMYAHLQLKHSPNNIVTNTVRTLGDWHNVLISL